jgi:hypothetical protein
MSIRAARWLAVSAWVISLALVVLGAILFLANRSTENRVEPYLVNLVVAALAFSTVGWLRKKYDAARILKAYAAGLRDETDLARLSGTLISVVEKTVQPEHVSLWLRRQDLGARR